MVTDAGVDGATDELVVFEELHAATVSAAIDTNTTRILFAWARFGTTAVPNRAHAGWVVAGDGAQGRSRRRESSMAVKVSGSILRRIEDLLGLLALVAARPAGVPSTSDSNRSISSDERPPGRDMGSMAVMSYPTNRIRNVVLVGHSGSLTTMLAEALLVKAGAIERQAPDGLSSQINLIDTPGCADFVDEVSRTALAE